MILKDCDTGRKGCDYARLFVKMKKRDSPGGGKVTDWDKGSTKVVDAIANTDHALQIINVNPSLNKEREKKLTKSNDIEVVPTLITLDGERIEGGKNIVNVLRKEGKVGRRAVEVE